MKVPGSKMALHQGVLYSNHRNNGKKSKSSSSEPLCSDFEIYYTALSSGFLPNVSNDGVQNGPASESPRFE